MVDRLPPAPRSVKAVSYLLFLACGLGLLLTAYATWAMRTVPDGVPSLLTVLTRDDRRVLKDSWVLQAQAPVPLAGDASLLVWLGLGYLVFLPLALSIRLRYAPARAVTFLLATVLTVLAALATISDDDLTEPRVDRLSSDAHAAWLALLPPGYHGVHDATLIGMIACVFVACLLLDRPPARRFFPRRRSVLASRPNLRASTRHL